MAGRLGGERAEALVMGPSMAPVGTRPSREPQKDSFMASAHSINDAGIWSAEETWNSVYKWMHTNQRESRDSDTSDSARSSSSSHQQISPKTSSTWDTPSLFDIPTYEPSLFDPKPVAPSIDPAELTLLNELLKLNIQQSTLPMSMPSTSVNSSPWGLPEESSHFRMPQEQPRDWRKEEREMFSQLAMQEMMMMPRTSQMMRSSAIMEAQQRLEEVCEEYRQLEKERKQTEAELARHNLGKKISSSNGLPIPRLPMNPSRVDRLIVDFFREHARISTLLSKMEQLRGHPLIPSVHHSLKELLEAVTVLQHCRANERSAIFQQLRGEAVRYNEEKESIAMAQALSTVRRAALRARAANWCSLIWTLGPEDEVQAAQVERLVQADFTIRPPPIRPRPVRS